MIAKYTLKRGPKNSDYMSLCYEDDDAKYDISLKRVSSGESEWMISEDQFEGTSAKLDSIIKRMNLINSTAGNEMTIVKGSDNGT